LGVEIRDTGKHPLIPSNCSTVYEQLMAVCWLKDYKARPTFHDICDILHKEWSDLSDE
jgi:hypothetical protein